jgi:hypothetical protein
MATMAQKKGPSMKSLIFYASPHKLTNAHKLVTVNKQPEYYVRVDTFNGDCVQAMEKARCMDGETMLNTVNVEEP